MKNIKAQITKGGKIALIIDPSVDFGPSQSGNSIIVASSGGFSKLGEILGDEQFEEFGVMLTITRKISKKTEKPARRSAKDAETKKPTAATKKPTAATKKPTAATKKPTAATKKPAAKASEKEKVAGRKKRLA